MLLGSAHNRIITERSDQNRSVQNGPSEDTARPVKPGHTAQLFQALSENSAWTIDAHTQQITHLSLQVSSLVACDKAGASSQQAKDNHACHPEHLEGDLGKCCSFLLQYRLVF